MKNLKNSICLIIAITFTSTAGAQYSVVPRGGSYSRVIPNQGAITPAQAANNNSSFVAAGAAVGYMQRAFSQQRGYRPQQQTNCVEQQQRVFVPRQNLVHHNKKVRGSCGHLPPRCKCNKRKTASKTPCQPNQVVNHCQPAVVEHNIPGGHPGFVSADDYIAQLTAGTTPAPVAKPPTAEKPKSHPITKSRGDGKTGVR